MIAVLDALIGPLGLLLGGIAAVAVAWLTGKRKGAQDATQRRAADDAEGYAKERKRQDEIDIGHGATDDERIRRLRAIADGNGSGDD